MEKYKLFVIALLLVSIGSNCRAGRSGKSIISRTAGRGPLQRQEKDDDYLRHQVDSGFPYYVSIRSDLYEMHHCGGTLISPQWVLTSAWCMDEGERGAYIFSGSVLINSYTLDVGETSKEKDSENEKLHEEISIERVILHEDHRRGSQGKRPYDARFDVALIKLEHASEHEPVNLDIEGVTDCCQDVELWNVGFGRASFDGPWSEETEAVKYDFLPFDECLDHFSKGGINRYFQGGKKLKKGHSLCVSNLQNQCNLGMGSPLVARREGTDVLVGFVTGATEECAFRDDPFVFGNVSAHMEWILAQDDVLKDVSAVTAKRRLVERVEHAERDELVEKNSREKLAARASSSTSVTTTSYSYPVSISELGGDSHRCGGALIDPYYVLTAAHCVQDLSTDQRRNFTITIGSDETPPNSEGDHETMELDTVSDVIPREKDGKRKNDVALVRLPRKSKFDPVKLPYTMRRCCTNDTSLIVLARGVRFDGGTSSHLHAALMDSMGRRECMNRTLFAGYPTASFCAGHEVTQGALCSGDQGSPIVLATGAGYEVLVGIATNEIDDDCSSAIAQFYRIGFLMRWIRRVLKEGQRPNV